MTSADVLRAIYDGDQAIAACDDKRRLLLDAWPSAGAPQ